MRASHYPIMATFNPVSNETMSHTLFISDLHLQVDEPHITATFIDFINNRAPQAEALYILGDFFETWIGDDDHSEFTQWIIEAVRKLADTGTPVYFIRGNRDLLIGKQFAQAARVTLLSDPSVIQLYNTPTLLTHGDVLCTLDHRHQHYRRIVTIPWIQRLFLMLPLSYRRQFANRMRNKSRQRNLNTPTHIMDVSPAAVEHIMEQHNTPLLIHGHTHRPHIHEVSLGKRIVLGSWHAKGSVLVYREDRSFELETL